MNSRGGKRVGAGRKPVEYKKISTRIDERLVGCLKDLSDLEINRILSLFNSDYVQNDNQQLNSAELQQTWAFDYEDLQEQAKLIEKLQSELAQVNAENSLLKKQLNNGDNIELENKSLKGKVFDLECDLNTALYNQQEISKKFNAQLKKTISLEEQNNILIERNSFLSSQVSNFDSFIIDNAKSQKLRDVYFAKFHKAIIIAGIAND